MIKSKFFPAIIRRKLHTLKSKAMVTDMDLSYWELFCRTGSPEMYMKFKETENGHGTGEDDGRCNTDDSGQEQ